MSAATAADLRHLLDCTNLFSVTAETDRLFTLILLSLPNIVIALLCSGDPVF